jgi:hypothetical protein
MTDTDRLAALLHESATNSGWASCVHSPENEWLPWCVVIATRLVAAGVGFVGDADHYPGCDRNPCRCAGYTATPAPLDVDCGDPFHKTAECPTCGLPDTGYDRGYRDGRAATPAPLDVPTIVGLLNSDHGFRIQTITSGEQDCRCWFHVAARKAIEPIAAPLSLPRWGVTVCTDPGCGKLHHHVEEAR